MVAITATTAATMNKLRSTRMNLPSMTTTIDADVTPRTRFSVVEMTRTPSAKSVVHQERGGHEQQADHGQRQRALHEVWIDA